jgi:hypothetical protein
MVCGHLLNTVKLSRWHLASAASRWL